MVEREGSDLHVKVDSPPVARVHGDLWALKGSEPLTPEDTEKALHEIADEDHLRRSSRRTARSTSPMSSPGVSRFRVNAFRQRGAVSIALRAIPFQVRTIDDLGPARGRPQARRRAPRDHPPHRHHRLGQVDDPGGDDRPHQLDQGSPRRHAGGPDRVPAPGQALDHQPARGRRRHRELRPGDAAGPAPGPRRDPDRGDARRGDRAHRALGGRDRPPGAVHAPHPGRDRDDQPDHRLLPAPPPAAGAGDARLDPAGRDLAAAGAALRPRGPRRRLRGDGRSPAGSRT